MWQVQYFIHDGAKTFRHIRQNFLVGCSPGSLAGQMLTRLLAGFYLYFLAVDRNAVHDHHGRTMCTEAPSSFIKYTESVCLEGI